jgi:hypothetical protein
MQKHQTTKIGLFFVPAAMSIAIAACSDAGQVGESLASSSQALGSPVPMLQVIGRNTANSSFRTELTPSSWQTWTPLVLTPTLSLIEIQDVVGTGTQAMGWDGTELVHNIRDPSGNWAFWGNASTQMGTNVTVLSLGMADVVNPNNAMVDDMQLCAVSSVGTLYHGIRFTHGTDGAPSSSPSWSSLASPATQIGNPGGVANSAVTTDCAGFGVDLQLVVATNTGALFHTIRSGASPQHWQPWGPLATNINGLPAYDVSVANVNGDLHVVAVTRAPNGARQLWHNIRFSTANPSWQGWRSIPGSVNTFSNVAVGSLNGELHVVVLESGTGHPYHTTRHATSWDPFTDIYTTSAGSAPGPLSSSGQMLAVTGSVNDVP